MAFSPRQAQTLDCAQVLATSLSCSLLYYGIPTIRGPLIRGDGEAEAPVLLAQPVGRQYNTTKEDYHERGKSASGRR